MDAQFFFNRGIEKFRNKDYFGAIEDYTTAIKLTSVITPETITEHLPDGVSVHTNIFNIREGFAEIYFNRGLSYMDIGKYAEAYEDFSKIIDYYPNDAEVYFKRAIVNYALEDDVESKKDLSKAFSLDSKFTETFFWQQFQS